MKVAFIFGGTPHYYNKILNLIHAQEGFEVTVISPQKSGSTIGAGVFQTSKGVDFCNIHLQEYKTWYGKPFFKNLYSTLNSIQPNIVVVGWPYFLNFLFAGGKLSKLKKKGVKFIAKEIPFSVPFFTENQKKFSQRASFFQKKERIYNSPLYFRIIKQLRRRLYRKVMDGAVVYIDKGKDVLASYGLPKDKIQVTYNSIVTSDIFDVLNKFDNKGINILSQRKEMRLLHVGRLVKWKRVDLLIHAVHLLQKDFKEIQLSIVGDGPEMETLKNLAKELGVEKSIHFKGAIYDSEALAMCFLSAQVYILAGMGGLSINEAMCYSLPVICSICDGTEKHLVFEDVNGKYFESDNLHSLISAIRYILVNTERSHKMGANSRMLVEEKINENIVVERYLECFKNQNNTYES